MRARREDPRTASPLRSREGSRRRQVWGSPAAAGQSRPGAAAEPGSGGPHPRRRGWRRRPAMPRPLPQPPEAGELPSEPRCRSPAPQQSGVARKGDAAGSSRWSRRQALAALAAACLEHLATPGRRHAYAKPVGFAPVALFGLVRPLDGRLPETWIASGALWAPLYPTGLRREYTKATRPPPGT
jgi:hypothetical protein